MKTSRQNCKDKAKSAKNIILNLMKKILVIHGPNLDLLGTREPSEYGHTTLEQINTQLTQEAEQAGLKLVCFQSNHEGELIEIVHQAAQDRVHFIIINPAAFTHTSIALRDALSAVAIPFIEVHLSNIYAREPFRHHSYFSEVASGIISGLGAQSYLLALKAVIDRINVER